MKVNVGKIKIYAKEEKLNVEEVTKEVVENSDAKNLVNFGLEDFGFECSEEEVNELTGMLVDVFGHIIDGEMISSEAAISYLEKEIQREKQRINHEKQLRRNRIRVNQHKIGKSNNIFDGDLPLSKLSVK